MAIVRWINHREKSQRKTDKPNKKIRLRPITHYTFSVRVFGFWGYSLCNYLVADFFYNQGKQLKNDAKTRKPEKLCKNCIGCIMPMLVKRWKIWPTILLIFSPTLCNVMTSSLIKCALCSPVCFSCSEVAHHFNTLMAFSPFSGFFFSSSVSTSINFWYCSWGWELLSIYFPEGF